MQSLDVISINLWSILISLCNLIIMYLILRRFLYRPVRKVLNQRKESVDRQYTAANQARENAEADRAAWETRLSGAQNEANAILARAGDRAERKEQRLIIEAKEKADGILRTARSAAQSERERVQAELRDEIAQISALLAEKLLDREITAEDHKHLIDSFLDEIGENHDAVR